MSQFSENIRYLRETAGLSQAKFGKGFGVSRDNIASYERGSEPKMEFITKLVNFYHISVDDLFNADLKAICEEKSKENDSRENGGYLAGNMADEMTANLCQESKSDLFNSNDPMLSKQIYRIQLEEIKSLSATNAILQKENDELWAENAQLRGKLGLLSKQRRSAS
jgi:transcriptional regulator with XRE-family HTH domain